MEIQEDLNKVNWKNVFALFGIFALVGSVTSIIFLSSRSTAQSNTQTYTRATEIKSGDMMVNNSPELTITSTIPQSPPPSPRYVIYDDQLASFWQTSSSGCTVDPNATSYIRTGSHAIMIQCTGANSRWDFEHYNGGPVNTSDFHRIQFYILGTGPSPYQDIIFYLNTTGGINRMISPFIEGGSIVSGQWRKVSFPIAYFNIFNALYNTRMTHPSLSGSSAYYIDDVQLVCKGDANGDNVINAQDQDILRQEMNVCAVNCKADFNGDNVVNIQDFNILRNKFGQTCN